LAPGNLQDCPEYAAVTQKKLGWWLTIELLQIWHNLLWVGLHVLLPFRFK
jgi:hypothetical protein